MKRIIAALLVAASIPASAQDFEVDHNGNWILRAIVVGGKTKKQVRLIVDTGSEVSLLDASLFEGIKPKTLGKANVKDLGQTNRQLEVVEVEEVLIGPHRFKKFKALLSDLHLRFSGSMDHPVDGILGMDLMRNMTFQWDEKSQALEWGLGDLGRYDLSIPIEYVGNLPYLPIRIGGKNTRALFDTGAVGAGFIIPSKSWDDSKSTKTGSAFGQISFFEGVFEGQIRLGGAIWTDPPVDYVKQNTEMVILGNRLFRNNAIFIDFKSRKLYIRTGNLGMRVPASKRLKLALRWDGDRRLIIAGMKPGGDFEKAGFRPGDQLVRLGELRGVALTIRTAYEYLESMKIIQAIVLRDKKELELTVSQDASLNQTTQPSESVKPPQGTPGGTSSHRE